MNRKRIIASVVALAVVFFLMPSCSSIERKMLFFPTHYAGSFGLAPWTKDGEIIGFSRKVDAPKTVWLMLHGNGGQAADRIYALPCFSSEDSVFILEYPGYGTRKGIPSKASFNQAAKEAYLLLRDTYPKIPVCVVGESIGSGPASSLASLNPPPDKLVLVVPFDQLSLVAKDHYPAFLVRLLLKDDWDNVAALSNYKGPVDIFGAVDDAVILAAHAQALATAVPSSKFVIIDGGHNDWSSQGRVQIRN